IRSYKPEHYPEQFRRIRGAYETVLMEPSWRRDASDGQNFVEVELVERSDYPSSDTRAQALPDTLSQRLENLWQLACAGQEESAYAELVKLVELHPWREAIYLRLYWALTVAPGLDQQRDSIDWLLAGLAHQTDSQALRFEYVHQCAEKPELVLRHDIGQWIAGQSDQSQLGELLSARWRAAATLQRWDRLVADVELMRSRGCADGSPAWLQVLLLASVYCGWSKEPADQRMFDVWQAELSAARESHLPLTEQL